jgi:hypothetical protein
LRSHRKSLPSSRYELCNDFFYLRSELALNTNLNWPKFQDIDSEGEQWSLTVAAVKEIQRLGIHGEPGQLAARATTEAGFIASLVAWEKQMLPFDLQAFNCFHHGNKLIAQDRKLRRAYLAYGEAEGSPMSALKELLQRIGEHEVVAA